MHYDGPDVDAKVEDDNREQANLSSTPLADPLKVKDESETETSDTMQGLEVQGVGEETGFVTHMQKNGEIREDRARARTEKYMPR